MLTTLKVMASAQVLGWFLNIDVEGLNNGLESFNKLINKLREFDIYWCCGQVVGTLLFET